MLAGLESKGKSIEKHRSRSSEQLRSEVRKSTSKKRRSSSYRNSKEFSSKNLPNFTAQVKLESMKSKLVMSDSVLKQRLAKKPRLYNKVVEFVTGVNGELNGYFFVLHCASDSCDAEIQIAKLESCGKFTQGSKERRGRVKWKVCKETDGCLDSFIRVFTVSSSSCRPVAANAVSRIIIVEEETWDIF